MKSISLIVTTYNWPGALRLCLQSVAAQKQLPAEVIIADDGSDESTRQMIHDIQPNFPVPLIHVWQADEGFRVSLIRNKAAAAASGDYLVFTDGDVILHPYFIKDHNKVAQEGHYAGGCRVFINQVCTERRIEKMDSSVKFSKNDILAGKRRMHRQPILNWLRTRHSYRKQQESPAIGCNLAFWKNDFSAINGFDNNYIGWGAEDDDLCVRFYRYGLKRKFLKNCGIMFHLWHNERSRDLYSVNMLLLDECKRASDFRCKNGFCEVDLKAEELHKTW